MKQTSTFSVTGSRPASVTSRPASATKRSSHLHVRKDCFVDETLFASPKKLQEPEFDPPWAEKPRPRPLLFYTPSPGNRSSAPMSDRSGRSTPHRGTPRSGSKTHRHIVTHKPSYVDESLFGPVPKGADFPAPWEKETKTRPLLWCPPSYMSVEGHSARPSVRSARSHCLESARMSPGIGDGHNMTKTKTLLSNQTKKPAWR